MISSAIPLINAPSHHPSKRHPKKVGGVPALGPDFKLGINYDSVTRNPSLTAELLVPDAYIRVDDGFLTYSREESDGVQFALRAGHLTTERGKFEAYITGPEGFTESLPIRVGSPSDAEISTTFSLFYDGMQNVLAWDTRRFPVGTASAEFCAIPDPESEGRGRISVFWDAKAPEGCTQIAVFQTGEYDIE
ncbi:hypothetical protein ABW20_dc0102177 [Dactylellina cionopaga]|nr:hypothetical protein ABW20_dc0102177 [Dactylellina cionopaga]